MNTGFQTDGPTKGIRRFAFDTAMYYYKYVQGRLLCRDNIE